MKPLLFTLTLLAFTEISAQVTDPGTGKTKIEEFQSRNGSLILKEYIDIATTRTLNVQVVKMTLLPEKDERHIGSADVMGYYIHRYISANGTGIS